MQAKRVTKSVPGRGGEVEGQHSALETPIAGGQAGEERDETDRVGGK